MRPKKHIIPIFVPHRGCVHDCVFCNQRAITGETQRMDGAAVRAAITSARGIISADSAPELAFYGGSFTAIPEREQTELLAAAKTLKEHYPRGSIRISTRPDAIDTSVTARLRTFGVETVELGVQSMCDEVLSASGRGHTAADAEKAAGLLRQGGFSLILQMMTGLPGDTPEKARQTAERLIALRPAGVRIYPTVILRGTRLHAMWRAGEYAEHTVAEAVPLCAELSELFEAADIPVIRVGLNPSEALSAGEAAGGAYHPAFGELVLSRRYLNRAKSLLRDVPPGSAVTLGVHPARLSAMIGQHRENMEALTVTLGLARVKVIPAEAEKWEILAVSIDKPGEKVYN